MNRSRPRLLVIAGCNGSGKSTYSRSLVPTSMEPFDYDEHFLSVYHSMPDSELKEKMAHNLAYRELESSVERATSEKLDFCYETNFNSTPMYWPEIFRKQDYHLQMVYFCLNSIHEAKRRVLIRYQNGGHFVPDNEVEARYLLGYEHLNQHFREFDSVHLFDTSKYDSAPVHILSMSKSKVDILSNYPDYLKPILPGLTELIRIT